MKKVAILFVLLLLVKCYSALENKSEFEDWSFQNYYYNVPNYEVTFTKDMDLLPLEIENKSYNPIDLAPEYISPTLIDDNKKVTPNFLKDIKVGFKIAKIKDTNAMKKVEVTSEKENKGISPELKKISKKRKINSNSLFDHMYDEENERNIF